MTPPPSPPTAALLRRLERESGPDVFALLAERLPLSALTSLLLEVHRRRAAARTPTDVLDDHVRSPFVRPSPVSPKVLARFEALAWDTLPDAFEPVTLSPLCPLGASSAVSGVSQDWAVATGRGTEVVSDATNVLALEIAARRRALPRVDPRSSAEVHLAAHHRLVRPQFSGDAARSVHFALLALACGGRAEGGRAFEVRTVGSPLAAHLSVVRAYAGPNVASRVALTDFSGRTDTVEEVFAALRPRFSDVRFEKAAERTRGRGYDHGLAFQVFAETPEGEEVCLTDGGEVAWTQRLLVNRKERLIIGGLGSERLCSVYARPRGEHRP